MPLQYPRQIPAPRTAWIIHIVRNLLRALGCQFIEPINELGVAATFFDEPREAIATMARTEAMVTGFRIRTLSQTMSAFGGKADMTLCAAHVCF